ncbi:hypothetical protein FKP32DRAFT_280819 [Trametes sanguinea]|nr:hypothetical protein FKP32DRAFT_280819 [Trametes sanguinea]
MPAFEMPSEDLLANPSLNLSPPSVRGRSPSRGFGTPEPSDDPRTAKQSAFVFPPRSSTPRSKMAVSDQEDEPPASPLERKRERLPPLGPGIPRGNAPTLPKADAEDRLTTPVVKPVPTYREVRSNRGVPNIEIPVPSPTDTATDSPPPPIVLSTSSPERSTSDRPPMGRKRSQSSAAGTSSPAARGRALPTPDFRFPPISPLSTGPREDSAPSPLPTFRLPHGHERISPTHSSVSTISTVSTVSTTSSVHQTSQSLDASILPKRLASPGGSLATPPPIMRARSATAVEPPQSFAAAQTSVIASARTPSRRPSLNRLGSAGILDMPVRPFAKGEGRSGSPAESSFSQSSGIPLPGLRDVLKVWPSLPFVQILSAKCVDRSRL